MNIELITGVITVIETRGNVVLATIAPKNGKSPAIDIAIVPDVGRSEEMFQYDLRHITQRRVSAVCTIRNDARITTPSRVFALRDNEEEIDIFQIFDRMSDALVLIGSYQAGGLIADEVTRERHEMIMIARTAQRRGSLEQMRGLQQ